ncbi:amino acid permease-associated region [Melioribacter roseus P3M-2]|uniref:Amino acid permease-associated region n=1 Tax=Melioribacter roseus (strain DSM 23840 / JCM 17771 / VKM B-2668 / P3M-2) TaxID=1191523 RepID=I6Z5W7_MELRP|nr:amino acid permease [Melioribacter roseus]AFN74555.1 amino acid permease-associated region [Melioribacter roseus P3M-2]
MKQTRTELIRGLSLTAAVMIVAGSMIGSGIFRKPSTMAQQLGSPELLILVWIAAGLITLIGAFINAEMAGMFDDTGGQYIYFKKMYGDFTSYLYGWSILSVIQTGSQAAIAYVFAEYVGYFVNYFELPAAWQQFYFTIPLAGKIYPFFDFGTKSVAIAAIIFLTGINYIGVITGGSLQTVVTYIKIGIIVIFSLLLILLGNGSISNVYSGFQLPESTSRNLFSLIGLSFAGAFWAYDAWNNITFVSGEVKNANRNVPLGLLFGVLIVIGVYVLINIAYLYVMPISEMANSPLVAASAAEKVFGNFGGNLISLIVIISTFGALNGSILATARVPFAMSKSKLFFDSLGKVHPRFGTPHVSLIVQGIWSCVLVLSGTFDTITDYVMFASWLFYLLGAYGVFVMRKKFPDVKRPYKVWGYPYTPIIFLLFASYYLIATLTSDTENAMLGLILVFSGLPFYFYSKYRSKKL